MCTFRLNIKMLDLKFPEPSPSGLDCGLFCFFRLTDDTCSVALRARGNTYLPPSSLFILELEQLGEDSLHPYGNGNGNTIGNSIGNTIKQYMLT